MRLRLERYREVQGRLEWTSIVLLVLGGIGVLVGTFSLFVGSIMFFAPDPEGGVLWQHRSAIFLSVFTGLFPMIVSGIMIWRGIARRRDLGALRGIGALARQGATFGVDDVARALDVGPARAHRVVLDAVARGILEDSPMTPAPYTPAPPSPGFAPLPASGPAATIPNPMANTVVARPTPDAWIGAVLHGTYQVEARLGAGGMGLVFRGRHLRTGRPYAIKTLLPDARMHPDALRRFEREATAASALGHPNIVGVHDFNVTPDGTAYLVMDLLEGETLEQRLARVGSLEWGDARRLVLELGSALAAAHEHGLLHRDLKPANVLMARASGGGERPVLLDFGLVKPLEDAVTSRITALGEVVGTPLYMSPEQARGEVVDARSDLYALAAMAFEMVTGAPPFLDRTLASVYAQLLTTAAPAASSVAGRPLPPAVDAVLARALAKSREERYPDVRSFLAAVEAIPAVAPGLARGA
ncbi:MAG: serine/threonine protein kinase [Myxococcales bacterium]|nr:serine/threonine protein kinase [Myxococcales bacterium]